MTNVVFGAGHVTGAKIWMGYNEDVNMLDLCNRKAVYVEKTYLNVKAHVLKVTNISGGYQAVENFIKAANADYASFEHSNADNSVDNEPNEPNRVVVYRTVKNPGDGPCSTIGQACATILTTTLAQIQHRANGSGGDYYGVLGRAMRAGCKDCWLTEHGFHTNASCRAKLLDPNIRQQLAEKEVDAMAAYYGWTKKQEDDTVLQLGSAGEAVAAWQKWLIKWDSNALPKWKADGKFGSECVEWTNKFKIACELIADGKVDDITWAAMVGTINLHNFEEVVSLQVSLDEQKAKTDQALADNAILKTENDGLKSQHNTDTAELADAAGDIRNLLDFANKH